MKRAVVTSMVLVLLAGILVGQNQLENPGFEEWEVILAGGGDTIREPVDWSSLKTSDNPQLSTLAPVVCVRSSNAHSGNYSVMLTNIMSFIVVNGMATNGRVHPNMDPSQAYTYTDIEDELWNSPFTALPDSIAGWYKYDPAGSDSLQVKVILHRGFGKQPDPEYMDNQIAVAQYKSSRNTDGEWVRFSAPFTYFDDNDPEYVLVILNSGNGFEPIAGSIAHFDDLEMIYNSPPNAVTKPNSGTSGFIFVIDNRYLVFRNMQQSGYTTAEIRDMSGRLVWTGKMEPDRIDISRAGLKKGIYVVTLAGKREVYTQKILLY